MAAKRYKEAYFFRVAVVVMLFALAVLLVVQYFWTNAVINLRKAIITENIFLAFNESSIEILNAHLQEDEPNPLHSMVSAEEMLEHKDLIDKTLHHYLRASEVNIPYYWAIIERRSGEIIMGTYDQYSGGDIAILPVYVTSSMYLQIPYDLEIRLTGTGWQTPGIVYYTLSISFFCFLILLIGTIFNFHLYLRRRKEVDTWIDFIGNMIHEFKTPMASISLASELMTKQDIEKSVETFTKYASLIYKENNHLKEKIDLLLRSISIDTKSFILDLRQVDVHEEISNLAEAFTLRVKQKGGKLTLRFRAQRFIITGDRMHISNAVSNLLDNAQKYTDEAPEIMIETRSNANGIFIVIRDKGIGIKKEKIGKLFDKFYRIKSERSYRQSGYGLGLFYVSHVMRAHKGQIHVESKVGEGSVFELFFPYDH